MRMRCPKCEFGKVWKLFDGRRKCKRCGNRFAKERSIWASYRVSESAKRKLLEYFSLGVPVFRARFRLPCSYRTAERFFRDARWCMAQEEECLEPLTGNLEVDESAFGGSRKGKRGWGAVGKVLVLGILKRNGKVRVSVIPNREYETIVGKVESQTKPGSLYFTDDYQAYGKLSVRGDHVVVRKEKGRPVGRDHMNGIEGFWSYAKHWLYQYRGVHKNFFHLYLGEISYRFNHREEDVLPIIEAMMKKNRKLRL